MKLQTVISATDKTKPLLFKDAEDAKKTINEWAREVKAPMELSAVVDTLTEWELKNRFDENVMRVLDYAAAAIQKNFNKGNVVVTQTDEGYRHLTLPNTSVVGPVEKESVIPVRNSKLATGKVILLGGGVTGV